MFRLSQISLVWSRARFGDPNLSVPRTNIYDGLTFVNETVIDDDTYIQNVVFSDDW